MNDNRIFLPKLKNQKEFDGIGIKGPRNGKIEIEEYVIAFIGHVMVNNMGLKNIVDTIYPKFKKRLQNTLNVLKRAHNGITFPLNKNMFPQNGLHSIKSPWPKHANREYKDIIIGKAEILVLTSILETYRMFLDLIKAYELSLPLDRY